MDYNNAQLTSHNLALINQQSHFILNEEEPRMQFGNENVQLFEDHILPRTSPQLPIEMPSLTNEESNVFNGTSQQYSLLNEHDNQVNTENLYVYMYMYSEVSLLWTQIKMS